ncbi:MAG: class I SAM-dependent methyltransferase family protein [Methanothrix sp.]|nr:class I SAM-dependent methyltransferase family protein [Methanothrix sp.]
MPEKTLGWKVCRKDGEKMRRALVEMGYFDRNRKISSDESHVYLPVLGMNEAAEAELRAIVDFEPVMIDFSPEKRAPGPEDILGYRPSFEVVGDIALVEDGDEERVAAALMFTCKSIKTVLAPISDVEGEYRTRRFRHVAGEVRTTTIHKEHGLRYLVDLEGAYFTPRLGTERLRIAGLVKPGDVVLDMFAGVGPFSLLLAKMGASVIAIDKNPVAVRCLRENARLNKISHIEILEGDSAQIAGRYKSRADHVIMNLPHTASSFLLPAIQAARTGGVVHYYCIASEDDLYKDEALIEKAAQEIGAGWESLYKGIVRSYAPRRHNVVIDFRVKKSII